MNLEETTSGARISSFSSASFENPWIPENSDSDVDPNITLISDSFIDFVIQENILISHSSSQLQFTLMGLAVFIFVTALITVFISKKLKRKNV